MHPNFLTRYAQSALGAVEFLGLCVIAVAAVFAAFVEVQSMVAAARVTLADLLQLFLYLEILAMVGVYFSQGSMPVRYPLYIAIVALARYLVLDMKNLDEWRMLGVSSSILLLTLAVLGIRYGHVRLSYGDNE